MFITTLFWLFVAHACTDVWWQDFRMISMKSIKELDGRVWMLAHALINGAGVAIVTGNPVLGIAETVVHGITDTLKCEHKIGLQMDQSIHLVSKIAWSLIA